MAAAGLTPPPPAQGQLRIRGQVTVNSWSRDATVTGLTPGAFGGVTGPVFFGLNIVGPDAPFFMTTAESTAILDLFTPTLQGLVPASGGGTVNFLRADGTWAPPSATGSQTWADTLAVGRFSGGVGDHPTVSFGDELRIDSANNDTYIGGTADIKASGGLTARTNNGSITLDANGLTADFAAQGERNVSLIAGAGTMSFIAAGEASWAAGGNITLQPAVTTGLVVLSRGYLSVQETASSAPTVVAGFGMFWVRSSDNLPMYTGSDNIDHVLAFVDSVTGPVFMGRSTGTGAPIAMSPTLSTSLLNTFTTTLQGLVPASGGGTVNFLRADGTFAVPPGTAPGAGSITNSQLANMAANTIKANPTAGSAAPQDFAISAESIFGRSSGNLTNFAMAVQSTVIRAGGSVFGVTFAADQVLRRAGSGDLGAGTLVTGNLGNAIVTDAKLDDMTQNSLKARVAGTTGVPSNLFVDTEAVVGRASGTIGTFLSVNNSALIRGSGSLGFQSAASDQVLRRDGTGSLGFGSINLGHISGLTSTSIVASGDQLQRAAVSGDITIGQNSNTASISAGVIVNNDISASAAIDTSKLGALLGEVTKSSGSTSTAIVRSTTFAWTGPHTFTNNVRLSAAIQWNGVTNAAAGNNVTLGSVGVLRLTSGTVLTGIVAPSAPTLIVVANATASDISVIKESGSSSAANRFGGSSSTVVIAAGNMMMAWYDSTSSRWRAGGALS
jgi:hypothetical protein